MKIYKFLCILILSALPILPIEASANTMFAEVENNFCNISDNQQLAVYWYWIAGNMSKEGVIKDLQAMKKVGINRVQIGIIGEGQGALAGKVKFYTDEWWNILHQALKTAGDLNIEVGLFNCPGWSQSGGPWVKASQAMRYLDCRRDTVIGPRKFVKQLVFKSNEAQLVKVLAFPLIEQKSCFSYTEDLTKDKEIFLHGSQKTSVKSLVLQPVSRACSAKGKLYVKNINGWKLVQEFNLDRSNVELNVGFAPFAPLALSLPETDGQEFKLEMSEPNVLSNILLSDVPVVEKYAEKTFAKMWQTPHPMWDAYMWREQPNYESQKIIQSNQVLDITDKVNAQGELVCTVPKGKWVILNTAMIPTGTTNTPAPKEATGYETDKMSKEHIRAHFDNYLGKILERIPAQDRKTFRIVVEDSYETGGQNWTDNMIPDFKAAYHYDPVPYIPVFSGIVVGSEEESDRFLWDVRRLIADEVSYNYVGGLRQVSHEHGLTTWLENYGHWGYPGEFLQYGSQSDEIAGEFWSFGDLGDIENRCASSCGHIYGKKKVWAESFTCGGPDFTQYPGQMKQRGDRFFTEGINSTLLHLYIQQPDDKMPGINAWFGNEFNRNNTWFSQMDVFTKYLKRCNYMLQQGTYIADVAYFLGEDAPKMTGVRDPEIPKGYSYDYVNAEVLKTATVVNGKLRLKSGVEYSVLVLPKIVTMRPELLKKLKELVSDGLVMLGPDPTHSPSLQNYPEADKEVKTLAEEMWQTASKTSAQCVKFGKGRIYANATLEQVFNDLAVVPDCKSDNAETPILFIHNKLLDGDYYFVSNQSDQTIKFNASFRITGKQPELWNPLEANVRVLPQFTFGDKITAVPMELEPFESAFVVFRKSASMGLATAQNYPVKQILTTVDKPWTVMFEQDKGGPVKPVKFVTLTDWAKNDDVHIKYFSGSAVYSNSFKLGKLPKSQIYMDLGKVMVLAKVKINGHEVGGVWTAPYRLNITKYAKKGHNTVEVTVVNCWRNRIIGEKNLPEDERFTSQCVTYLNKDSELQSSGLLGPVEINAFDYQMISNP